MPINTRHPEYNKWSQIWEQTRDFIAGEHIIKQKKAEYLPKIQGMTDESYKGYAQRAKYINFVDTTVKKAVGQLFRKPLVINDFDEDLIENIDLNGTHINYAGIDIAREVLELNRIGVFVDYSVENDRPYCKLYNAESIINWKTRNINGVEKLCMVVIEGKVLSEDPLDPYNPKDMTMWKELYLDENGLYWAREWLEAGKGFVEMSNVPIIRNNNQMDYIPFYFITGSGISSQIKKSPVQDIVSINAGHFINSADHENMVHWCCAKTIATKGYGNSEPVPVGGAFDLPTDGDAFFLEASAVSVAADEMKRKEDQMSIMDSTLISSSGRYLASAETSRLSNEGSFATLAGLANALSDGLTKVCRELQSWRDNSESDATVEYNTDYETTKLSPQEAVNLMALRDGGGISNEVFMYNLRQAEFYPPNWSDEDEESAKGEDQEERDEKLKTAVENMYNQTGTTPAEDAEEEAVTA